MDEIIQYLWLIIKFIGIFFASYKLVKLIANDIKWIAIFGAITITFSGAIIWNLNNIDSLLIGEIMVLVLNYFFKTDKKLQKVFYIILLCILGVGYTFTFKPFAVSFGYIFIALSIWIILENKSKLKENLLLEIVGGLLLMICLIISGVILKANNLEYLPNNSHATSMLFTYLYNVMLPFTEIENKEILGSIVTAFPAPMIMALVYLYKKENHINFLLPIIIVIVFETIFCISGFGNIINKITLFSYTSALRTAPAICFGELLILIYFCSNVTEDIFEIKWAMRISLVLACLSMFIGVPSPFSSKKFLYLFVLEITLISFLSFNYTDKRYQKVLMFFLALLSLISGVPAIL